MRGSASGPRSFSMCRSRAARIRSWYSTRPDTSARLICPSSPARSSSPTATTAPCESPRPGTTSTYTIGSRSRAASISSRESMPPPVAVVSSVTRTVYQRGRRIVAVRVARGDPAPDGARDCLAPSNPADVRCRQHIHHRGPGERRGRARSSEDASVNLTQGLHRAVQQDPDGIATVFGRRTRTHAESVDRIARLAAGLTNCGVEDGERAAILSLNSDRYHEFLAATLWAGGVVVPVNLRWSITEIAESLSEVDARVLVVD